MEERANPKHAFDFVLDTFERKCDFSTVSMTSDFIELERSGLLTETAPLNKIELF